MIENKTQENTNLGDFDKSSMYKAWILSILADFPDISAREKDAIIDNFLRNKKLAQKNKQKRGIVY